jgi:hypothetical protein
MNSFVNVILLALTFPLITLAIIVGFDLPVEFLKTSGNNLTFIGESFLILASLMGLIAMRRSVKRWMGMKIVNTTDRFLFNFEVSKERKNRVVLYNLLESSVMVFIGLSVFNLTHHAIIPMIVLLSFAFDNLLFLLVGYKKRFRIGLSSKALIVSDREVTVLYFEGLRKISIEQQTIYFDYIKDLQLSFPVNCLREDDKAIIFAGINDVVDKDKVMFSKIGEWN